MDGFQYMSQFLKVVRDKERGAAYRDYAGFLEKVPCEGTFSNFRARLGVHKNQCMGVYSCGTR